MALGQFAGVEGLGSAEWTVGDEALAAISAGQDVITAKRQVADARRLAISDVSETVKVCSAFPADQRTAELSFAHHAAVIPLCADERASFLQRASAEAWSARQLRHEVLSHRIASGDHVRLPEDDPEDREYLKLARLWNHSSKGARELFAMSVEEVALADIVL